jgi:hypothetical protein
VCASRRKTKMGARVSVGAAVNVARGQTMWEPTHGYKVMCSGNDALVGAASVVAALPVGRDVLRCGVRGADGLGSGEDGGEDRVHGGDEVFG